MRLAPTVFATSALVVMILGGVAGWTLLAVSRLVDARLLA